MATSKSARCPRCGSAERTYAEAGGTYTSRCIGCGLQEAGTVSYPVPVEELAQAHLLVRCSSSEPTAHDLSAIRRIFPELAEEGLHLLRAKLRASPQLKLGPYGCRLAGALKADAEAAGLVVRTEPSETAS
jgi:hypothetical protein